MINPYYCYAISFVVAMMAYLLGWSDLYPKLSVSLFIFLSITVLVHLAFGRRIFKSKKNIFRPIQIQNNLNPLFITITLYLLWGWEFLYEDGIPILKILLKQSYNYRLFGIPSFHVFIVTFSSFYTIYLFHIYLSSHRKRILLLFMINLLAALLIYNRSMFLFNISASFFLFLFSLKKIPASLYYLLPLILFVILYLFGIMGTLRASREAKVEYDNALFLDTGKAEKSFVQSPIPKEFFWGYIYVTSPLANFQENINTYPVKPVTRFRFLRFVNDEIIMDFISKRINTSLHIEPEKDFTIPGPFNVSTVYSRSYCYLGWPGIIVMAMIVLAIPWLYLNLLPLDSPYFLSGLAILCSMFLFLAFDNTLRFTGLSFQLTYPFILHFGTSVAPSLIKIFTKKHNATAP